MLPTVVKKPNDPVYSLFVPFVRYWCVQRFLVSLLTMDLPRQSMEIVFFNDTRDVLLQQILHNWLLQHGQDFNGATLYQSGREIPNEFDIAYRRTRICVMKEKSKELIANSKYIFGLEDDTIAPPNAFTRLLEHITANSSCAVVSGVEVGRHTIPFIGVWTIEPLEDPIKISSVPYMSKGTQEVDGCGWYCYITPTDLYKQAHYRYEAECLGPDVVYAWDQRRAGYKVLVDWNVLCNHMMENGKWLIPSNNTAQIVWDKYNNDWILELQPAVMNAGVTMP